MNCTRCKIRLERHEMVGPDEAIYYLHWPKDPICRNCAAIVSGFAKAFE